MLRCGRRPIRVSSLGLVCGSVDVGVGGRPGSLLKGGDDG